MGDVRQPPIVTFDMDGVIAGGVYTPAWHRTPEVYLGLPLLEQEVPALLTDIARNTPTYVVTSRQFPGALASTRAWLAKHKILPALSGVIVRPEGFDNPQNWKAYICRLLGSMIHFDDDPSVINLLHTRTSTRGMLVLAGDPMNRYDGAEDFAKTYPWVIRGWKDVGDSIVDCIIQTKENYEKDNEEFKAAECGAQGSG